MTTSTPHQQAEHFVCHIGGFCQWVDGNDQHIIDLLFLGTTLVMKSILGPKQELTQNVGIKSTFSPIQTLLTRQHRLFHWACLVSAHFGQKIFTFATTCILERTISENQSDHFCVRCKINQQVDSHSTNNNSNNIN